MSDWSKFAAERVQRRTLDAGQKDTQDAQDENFLNSNAPRMWAEFRELVIQMSTDLNAESGMHGRLAHNKSDPNALKIEDTEMRMTTAVTFNPERHEIKIGGLAGSGKLYKLAVTPGTHEIRFTAGGSAVPVDKIAQGVLESLLGI